MIHSIFSQKMILLEIYFLDFFHIPNYRNSSSRQGERKAEKVVWCLTFKISEKLLEIFILLHLTVPTGYEPVPNIRNRLRARAKPVPDRIRNLPKLSPNKLRNRPQRLDTKS